MHLLEICKQAQSVFVQDQIDAARPNLAKSIAHGRTNSVIIRYMSIARNFSP